MKVNPKDGTVKLPPKVDVDIQGKPLPKPTSPPQVDIQGKPLK